MTQTLFGALSFSGKMYFETSCYRAVVSKHSEHKYYLCILSTKQKLDCVYNSRHSSEI